MEPASNFWKIKLPGVRSEANIDSSLRVPAYIDNFEVSCASRHPTAIALINDCTKSAMDLVEATDKLSALVEVRAYRTDCSEISGRLNNRQVRRYLQVRD